MAIDSRSPRKRKRDCACVVDGTEWSHQPEGDPIMGKYFLDWIMGVPVVVLIIITYFILN